MSGDSHDKGGRSAPWGTVQDTAASKSHATTLAKGFPSFRMGIPFKIFGQFFLDRVIDNDAIHGSSFNPCAFFPLQTPATAALHVVYPDFLSCVIGSLNVINELLRVSPQAEHGRISAIRLFTKSEMIAFIVEELEG
jgi:hypothetical protein